MSVRPHLYMVVGINDAVKNDPRCIKHMHSESFYKPVFNAKINGVGITNYLWREEMDAEDPEFELADYVYNPGAWSRKEDDYGYAPGVVGYILSEMTETGVDALLYEVVHQLSNTGEDGPKDGHLVVGNAPYLTEDHLRRRFMGLDLEPFLQAYRENRLIRSTDPFTTDLWFAIAVEILRQSGWKVQRSDLKIMLVWNWS